ncbi:hypothetical protein FRC11_006852 [Ceratobasidium sp. 423]|nr:hypothetical protein FRC11_006852 [Ceratobasidium sp. 423]
MSIALDSGVKILGAKILLSGLILQTVTLTAYMNIFGLFVFRLHKNRKAEWGNRPNGILEHWLALLLVVGVSLQNLSIRGGYRMLVAIQGPRGSLSSSEQFFYTAECVTLWGAISAFLIVWPPKFLTIPRLIVAKDVEVQSAGNGGDLGSISYQEMSVPMTKYGFAMASTNTGHNGSIADGTFAMNNIESQASYRIASSFRLSTVFSKTIVNAYYGQNSSYNYWLGCSSGGKQGMREVQGFPEDFDGALTGAPAQWLSRQNGFNIYVGQLNMNETTLGEVVPTSFFPTWAQEVLAQCDEIDGVKDNVILNPHLCTPDLSTVVCGATNASAYVNPSTCITEGQATTLAAVYKNWTSSATGELLFPSYDPGSESGWTALLSGTPFGLSFVKNETELERITAIGDETDPGQGNAVNPNLTPFFQKGGKLIAYHGLADANIPSGSSTHYYERVRAYYNDSSDLRNYYRLFLVPGMGHCEVLYTGFAPHMGSTRAKGAEDALKRA